jgi:hypothetical protein
MSSRLAAPVVPVALRVRELAAMVGMARMGEAALRAGGMRCKPNTTSVSAAVVIMGRTEQRLIRQQGLNSWQSTCVATSRHLKCNSRCTAA